MKNLIIVFIVVFGLAFSVSAFAAPVEKVDGFICPVLGGKAGMNGMHKGLTFIDDGVPPFYTVVGPDVSVPEHATNDNGDGVVHGAPHASPGDPDYTAIWGPQP